MPEHVAVGFYGKLPARGDFVRAGLSRDFTDRWDGWLQCVLAGSRAHMGEAWLSAYLEAPVWRFVLPAGMCGERAVLGVMLPSVDRTGRYFPLTFAALHDATAAIAEADRWLDRCEDAGRSALEQDTPPQELFGMLGTPDLANGPDGGTEAVWWTEGSPRVQPVRITLASLPDAATYAVMLGADAAATADRPDGSGQEAAGGTRWEPTP